MELGFEQVPTTEIMLPSRGLVYPLLKDGKVLDRVYMRPMTARDENKLHSPALLKSGKAIPAVIQDCIVEPKGIKIENLLPGDHAALMLYLRAISYGVEVEVEDAECPACGDSFPHTFVLDNLEEKQLDKQPISPNTNEFSCLLPLSKKNVTFQLMTIKIQEELEVSARTRRKKGIQDDFVTARLKALVLSIDGETDKAKISSFVDNMPAQDSLALRHTIDELEPDIVPKAEVTCPHCTETSTIVVPMRVSFFWPK